MQFQLNRRASQICDQLDCDLLRVGRLDRSRTRLFDFGVDVLGGLAAGVELANICTAGLARIEIVPGEPLVWQGPSVAIHTDHPIACCMASQYAGWQIQGHDYFAMGSGPMRAAAATEDVLRRLNAVEKTDVAVGVLESHQIPPEAICREMADACGVSEESLTLLIAPTASQAGHIQVVARSVETAMHKLFELEFDIERIVSGFGVAPLPPVAGSDLEGIGRTNDAVLYGARVTLWVRGDDRSLREIIELVPSQSSADHGRPFRELFERYDRDFYRIDPKLFSPAEVTLINLDTGNLHRSGQVDSDLISRSFEG